MTRKQKDKIKELKEDIKDLKQIRDDLFMDRDDWRGIVLKLSKKKEDKIQKICNFCGNPIDEKPESKKERDKRVWEGINKLKRRGVLK